MEFFLNICWLAIALGALSSWIASLTARGRSRRYSIHMEAVALSCVIILLLFPISMTDDLHPDVFVAAGIFCHRRDSAQLCAAHLSAKQPIGSGGTFLPAWRPVICLMHLLATHAFCNTAFSGIVALGAAQDRAPPSLSQL